MIVTNEEQITMSDEQTVNGNGHEPENGRIHVEEEATHQSGQPDWTEEFVVAGEELVGMVKKLVHETNIRRVVVKNEARRIHLEIPLLLGVAGIALLPLYSALALIAALVTDCTILVERIAEEPAEKAA
jgi:hypothetical protein